MKNLVGKKCAIVFMGDASSWPLLGFPCFSTVEAVDMPMVKLSVAAGSVWVNAATIKTIREMGF